MKDITKEMKVIIIGGGSWGVAIASLVALKVGKAFILCSNKDRAKNISNGKIDRFPNIILSPNIYAGINPKEIMKNASLIIIATEVKRALSFCKSINEFTSEATPVLLASKGFSNDGKVLALALSENLSKYHIGVISGPSFAGEVMNKKPTALLVSGKDLVVKLASDVLHSQQLRIYGSNDVIGASIAGAMKNVIAIACGISSGLNLGENARAALLTRGLAETVKLTLALGGKIETIFGLAGIGDMALSSFSSTSRNFSWGNDFSKNQNSKNVLVEGLNAAKQAHIIAQKHNIEMPITELVARITDTRIDLIKEINKLIERPPIFEWSNL